MHEIQQHLPASLEGWFSAHVLLHHQPTATTSLMPNKYVPLATQQRQDAGMGSVQQQLVWWVLGQ
jgi:hypothetical protein